jgi:hypothetical protein
VKRTHTQVIYLIDALDFVPKTYAPPTFLSRQTPIFGDDNVGLRYIDTPCIWVCKLPRVERKFKKKFYYYLKKI